LAQAARVLWVDEEITFRVRMRVDEPRRDDQSTGVDDPLGGRLGEISPRAVIVSPVMAMSARYPGDPVPSTTVPPVMSTSNIAISSSERWAERYDACVLMASTGRCWSVVSHTYVASLTMEEKAHDHRDPQRA